MLTNYLFTWSYVETDSQGNEITLAEDSVNLEIKVQDLEKNKNVTVPSLQIGAPANLSYQMDIYPKPKNDDYEWTIYDKSTNTKIEVKPGTKFDGEIFWVWPRSILCPLVL